MVNLINPEEKITCPYDPNHTIMKRRFIEHLTRCEKTHPNSGLVCCTYNTRHRIEKSLLQEHYKTCPDRKVFDIYKTNGDVMNRFPIQNREVATDDNWDDDNYEKYDPTESCIKNNVLRSIKVETPSTKKYFYGAEEKRVRQHNSDGHKDLKENVQKNTDQNNARSTKANRKGRTDKVLLKK